MVVAMKITEHWALHSDRCLKPAHGLNAPLVIMQVAELACRPTMECSHVFWLASAHGHGPPVASVPTLDALSCDEPRKAWSTAGQALTGFAGVRRNPSHL